MSNDKLKESLLHQRTVNKLEKLPYFSFSYGENTSLSISVMQCHFQVCALPQQGKYLVETELHVMNDKYSQRVEGKV